MTAKIYGQPPGTQFMLATDSNHQNPYQVVKRKKLDLRAAFQESIEFLCTAVTLSLWGMQFLNGGFVHRSLCLAQAVCSE